MKYVKYFALNGVFAYAVYAGVLNGQEGWANIVKFLTIVMFVIGILAVIGKEQAAQELAKKKQKLRTIPVNIDIIYDFAITFVFAYVGWFGYAAMYLAQTLMIHAFADRVDEIITENA